MEDPKTCIARMQDKLCPEDPRPKGKECFIPYRYQRPILVSMIAVDDNFRFAGYRTFRSHSPQEVVRPTWDAIWDAFCQLNINGLVTFNGKRFDLPLLETWAMRMGLFLPFWFAPPFAKVWENPRAYSEANPKHIDVCQYAAGSAQTGGDLHYWSRLFELPGKVDTSGSSVTALYEQESWDTIEDYCLCDCLNTLGVFMGLMSMHGGAPRARSPEFEAVINAVSEARRNAGTTSKELDRFWTVYNAEIPF